MFLLCLIGSLFASDVDHIAKWRKAPDVVYCENSSVSLSDTKQAIEYWKSKGYSLGDLSIREYCSTRPEYGLIKIGPPDSTIESDNYGHTHIKWSYGTMDFAVVVISDEGSSIYEVVVHEFGHALGLDHSHNVNNIMYERHVGAYTKM